MTNRDVEPEDLARCRAGDPRGLAAVYDVVGDRVYRLCRGVLGNDADAEDAAQEVLLRVLEKARSFDGRSRFSTWVYRLTVNHALNFRRQRDRRRPASLEAGLEERHATEPSPADAAARSEAHEALDRLLAALPDDARAILSLREVEALSYREIAAALDVPVGTVMSRLARARARLLRAGEKMEIMMESRP